MSDFCPALLVQGAWFKTESRAPFDEQNVLKTTFRKHKPKKCALDPVAGRILARMRGGTINTPWPT